MNLVPFFPLPKGAELISVMSADTQLAVLHSPVSNPRGVVHFVHGFTGSKEDAWLLIELFNQRGYSFIAHDNRGQFQSAHAEPSTYVLPQLADDIHSIHQQLGYRDVHVIGHSFGGLVTQQFALTHQPASLTLLCTGPGALRERKEKFDYTREFIGTKQPAEVRDYWLATRDPQLNLGFPEANDSVHTIRWLASDMESVKSHLSIMGANDDVSQALAQRGIATQVVYGQFDDAWPIAEQARLAATLHAPLVEISESGHCPNEDNPQALVDVVTKFIEGVAK